MGEEQKKRKNVFNRTRLGWRRVSRIWLFRPLGRFCTARSDYNWIGTFKAIVAQWQEATQLRLSFGKEQTNTFEVVTSLYSQL